MTGETARVVVSPESAAGSDSAPAIARGLLRRSGRPRLCRMSFLFLFRHLPLSEGGLHLGSSGKTGNGKSTNGSTVLQGSSTKTGMLLSLDMRCMARTDGNTSLRLSDVHCKGYTRVCETFFGVVHKTHELVAAPKQLSVFLGVV